MNVSEKRGINNDNIFLGYLGAQVCLEVDMVSSKNP